MFISAMDFVTTNQGVCTEVQTNLESCQKTQRKLYKSKQLDNDTEKNEFCMTQKH